MYLHHHYISLNIGNLSPSPLELMIPSEKYSIKSSNNSNRRPKLQKNSTLNKKSPNVIEIQKEINIKL